MFIFFNCRNSWRLSSAFAVMLLLSGCAGKSNHAEIPAIDSEKNAYSRASESNHFVFDDKLGLFFDKRTNLTWRRCAIGRKWSLNNKTCEGEGVLAEWGNMISLVKNEKYAGFSDWRLPTFYEYISLFPSNPIDCTQRTSIIENLFPNIKNQKSSLYGFEYWLADNSEDLLGPLTAIMRPYEVGNCRLALQTLYPFNDQPAIVVRGGSVPKEWTAALVSQKQMAKVLKNKKDEANKSWAQFNVTNVKSSGNRTGDFHSMRGPENKGSYLTWSAICKDGGYAYVNVDHKSPNLYGWGGGGFPGAMGSGDVGIGVEAAMRKGCRGRQ